MIRLPLERIINGGDAFVTASRRYLSGFKGQRDNSGRIGDQATVKNLNVGECLRSSLDHGRGGTGRSALHTIRVWVFSSCAPLGEATLELAARGRLKVLLGNAALAPILLILVR